MKTAAIVLAAGKSKRMGQNKLLLRLNNTTLIDNILDAVAAANINETVVVLGHKPEQIIEATQPRREAVKTVINKDFERGMISSFQKGLQVLPPVDAAFLILGDEPILDNNFLNAMIQQMENSRGRALLVSPIHKGKKGHPLLVHRQLFSEILDLEKTETMRDVIRRHADRLVTITAPEWTTMDVDTPEDYARIHRLMNGGSHGR
ncbi:MAG TPA: nucleotidyltransferase family protein [Candidatus Acidoferrales bacterium]|nr:nucleotidyltransferase family protein [Candidatus Acidoferrales bacterium]